MWMDGWMCDADGGDLYIGCAIVFALRSSIRGVVQTLFLSDNTTWQLTI